MKLLKSFPSVDEIAIESGIDDILQIDEERMESFLRLIDVISPFFHESHEGEDRKDRNLSKCSMRKRVDDVLMDQKLIDEGQID